MNKDEREDVNQNGIDDEIEPPMLDVAAGSEAARRSPPKQSGHGSEALRRRYRCTMGGC